MKRSIYSFLISCCTALLFTLIIFSGGKLNAQAQQLYFQNFNSTYSEWSLNTGDLGDNANANDNYWYVSNDYAGASYLGGLLKIAATPDEPAGVVGYPESNYLHITNGTNSGITSDFNCNFLAPEYENQFARMNTPLVTTGYDSVTISFWFLCYGGDNYYHGKLYYSLNGGTTWVQEGGTYGGTTKQVPWSQTTITDPAWSNAASLEFAFEWVQADNSAGGAAKDPAFAVDDIKVTAVPVVTCPVKITNQSSTNPTCNNANSGTITLTASDTAVGSILTYHISNGTIADSNKIGSFTGLAAGTYTISVSSQTCASSGTNIVIGPPNSPKLVTTNFTITQPTCGLSNGSTKGLSVTGGTGNLSEVWKNASNVTISTDSSFSNQPAGTYTFTVTDGSGCTADTTITLNPSSAPTLDASSLSIIEPTCGSSNGKILNLSANGGATPYKSTIWTNSGGTTESTTFNLQNQPGGAYTFTLTDQAGCTTDTTITLIPAGGATLVTTNYVITEPTCGSSNGGVSGLTATGGGTPYKTTIWTNSGGTTISTTFDFSNQPAGTYNFVLTDQNGCTTDTNVTLTSSNGAKLVTSGFTITQPSCGLSNGSATGLSATGGSTPYTSTVWTNSGGTPVSPGFDLTGQPGGTYTFTLTDKAGCITDTSITLNPSTAPQLNTGGFNITQPTCGAANGAATGLSASGGLLPYKSTVWTNSSNVAISNTYDFSNQPAGTYTFTLTDGANCVVDTTITLAASNAPKLVTNAFVITEPTCNQSNGAVSGLNATGGATPYKSTVWTNGSGTAISNSYDFSNQPAGTYTFILTDNSGCTADTNITLAPLGAPKFVTSGLTIQNPTCGQANGSVTGLSATGGSTPYATTVWTNGSGTPISTTYNFNGQPSGTYTFTLTDGIGCVVDTEITLTSTASAALPLLTSTKDTICSSGDTTQICVTDTAAGSSYISYSWNVGGSTSCINTSVPGNYYLTVTDANNCTVSSSHLSISVLEAPSISTGQNGDTLSCYGAASCQWYLNGTAVPAPAGTDSVLIATVNGSYTVLITATDGCKAISNPIIDSVSAINNVKANIQFDIFPNPVTEGVLELRTPSQLIGTGYQIFDVAGRLVYSSVIRKEQNEINIASYANGAYLFKIGDVMKKFIKE